MIGAAEIQNPVLNMKVISTNIGEARTVDWKGMKIQTGIFKFAVDEPVFLGNEDVEKDHVVNRKYHGGVDKACYLYSADHYDHWKTLYPSLEMPWGMFGENLTVEGLHEAEMNIGDMYRIGEALVQVTQPRQPCFKLQFRFGDERIYQQFIDASLPGVYVRVLENGKVKAGDTLQLVEKQDTLSVQKIYELLFADEYDPAVKAAVNDPNLAESCRKDLLKRWGEFVES